MHEGYNYYDVGGKFYLVDLPGYGKARVSHKMEDEFHGMIRDYLTQRPNKILHRTLVLIDARRGVMEADKQLLDILGDLTLCV